jgi:tetratricopeptide (TPR) repeat protein
MASQYSKKAVKLARDQKQRLESEVDEETARRFVTDTQRMLETDDTAGLNVKEAKKLFGLSISFLAEGNYVTGMQYSKKVRRILEELRERLDAMPATREAVEVGLESLQASIAELKRAGNDTGGAEGLLDMARMFFQEEDYQPAREQLLRARALVLALKEKDRPFTAPQWKDVLTRLKEKTDRLRGDGLRIEEPMKMLRLSESFALQGNLEVASQYIRKAEKLLSDIEDRARARSQKKETVDTGPPRCPRCGEESEADWVVCAYCNTRLKAEPPAAPDGSMPPPDVGEIRIARPVEENEQRSTGAPVREVKKAVKVIRPGNR